MRVPHSLIVFSGLDGAGKSTQIGILRARLARAGVQSAVVWIRGGYTPLFEAVKRLTRRASGRHLPPAGPSAARTRAFRRPALRRLWLALALLDLLLLVGVRLRWLARHGRVVICDRYLIDTLIDLRLNFPAEHVPAWLLWRLVERLAPRPDAAFLLLVPVSESVRRSDVKGEPFRDTPSVLAARLAHYDALARGYVVLDGTRPAGELAATIARALGLPAVATDAYQPAA